MCEAEDHVYELTAENRELRRKLESGDIDDFPALCDAVDDMRRGICTPADVIAVADRLRHRGSYWNGRAA